MMMMMMMMISHGVQKVLLNKVRYNKRNYITNTLCITQKINKVKAMIIFNERSRADHRKTALHCLYNDSKTSAYVMYCPQGMTRSF
jgi:hypothetical protein